MPYLILLAVALGVLNWSKGDEVERLKTRIAELEKQYGVQGGTDGE
jgi:hypothetical protein